MSRIILKYVIFNTCLFFEQGVSRQRIRSVSYLVNSLSTAMRTLFVDKVNDLKSFAWCLLAKANEGLLYSLIFVGTVATKVAQSRISPTRCSKKSERK